MNDFCTENKNGICNVDGACCVGYESANCPKHENGCTYNIFGNCNIDGGACVSQSLKNCPVAKNKNGK